MTDPHLVAGSMVFVERTSAEIVAALRAGDVRSILIKGPLQQRWLASAGAVRHSVDVDVLVEPDTLRAAGAILTGLGYSLEPEVTPGVEHHAERWSSSAHLPVELHWTVWGAHPGRAWPVLGTETENALIDGDPVEIPNEPARCLLVALHAAHHGGGEEAPSYDLERALVVARRASWERALELARALGAEPAFTAALGLVFAGEEMRDALGLSADALTERLALNVAPPTPGAPGYYWLARQRGARARAGYVARKIFPPADFMRFKYPLARDGRGGLALSYGYRILWLARWAIPGFLAWRRARKAAGGAGGDV